MADFLLIHGSWFGAWCWDRVVTLLRESGHRALAIDLPGHGEDRTPLNAIGFDDYVETVTRQAGSSGMRSILVGHSMAAMVAAHTADRFAERVAAVVAVAGLQIPSGVSMLDGLTGADPEYLASIVWSDDRSTALISPEGASRYLYQLCPDIAKRSTPRLTAEPIRPYETPLTASPEIYHRVPHYYIGCREDKAVLPSMQSQMCKVSQPTAIFDIAADHCPFFSAPEELVDVLIQISTPAGSGHPHE